MNRLSLRHAPPWMHSSPQAQRGPQSRRPGTAAPSCSHTLTPSSGQRHGRRAVHALTAPSTRIKTHEVVLLRLHSRKRQVCNPTAANMYNDNICTNFMQCSFSLIHFELLVLPTEHCRHLCYAKSCDQKLCRSCSHVLMCSPS